MDVSKMKNGVKNISKPSIRDNIHREATPEESSGGIIGKKTKDPGTNTCRRNSA